MLILRCVFVSVFVTSALGYGEPHYTRWPRATPAPTTPLTTKVYLWELIWAAKVDPGEYTTMAFQYYNDQMKPGNYPTNKFDRCYDDFMKCNLAYTLPHTVCAFKWLKDMPWLSWLGFGDEYQTWKGIMRPVSYCDLYHENCLSGKRTWRLLNYGWCKLPSYPNLWVDPLDKYSQAKKDWYRPPKIVDYEYKDPFLSGHYTKDYYYMNFPIKVYE